MGRRFPVCDFSNTALRLSRLAERLIVSSHSCPLPEIVGLGRTLRRWKRQVLAHFETRGASNGGAQAVNLVIDKTRSRAYGRRMGSGRRLSDWSRAFCNFIGD